MRIIHRRHHSWLTAAFLTLALALVGQPAWLPQNASAADSGSQPASSAGAAQPVIAPMSATGLLDLIRANSGKAIFINFFATWCPPCREEIPDLIRLRKEYSEKDLMIIGISLDEDPLKLVPYARLAGFNYPVYRATDEIAPIIGISSIPHNMVYDREGRLVISEAGMVDPATLRTFLDALLKDGTNKNTRSGSAGQPGGKAQ